MTGLEELRVSPRQHAGGFTLILSFDNDRHHSMYFQAWDSPTQVAKKLREMAERLMADPLLD